MHSFAYFFCFNFNLVNKVSKSIRIHVYPSRMLNSNEQNIKLASRYISIVRKKHLKK